ncbi:MAG: formylglycine-generating enzyme family protein [Planctomycetes bacterium]|nr:formylglycine-generating enzyme family protein [Planctomycetota bacterium]
MRAAPLAALLLLASCAGGSPGSSPSGSLAVHQAETRSDWQVLDLRSGTLTALPTPPGSLANWSGALVPMRLIRGAIAAVGQEPGTFARQGDEVAGVVAPAPFAIAAQELTRGQWRLIAGSAPWEALEPASVRGQGGDELPATGISYAEAESALAGWSAAHGLRLVLPSAAEWELAARAGGGPCPWGGLPVPAAASWAVTADTVDPPGPRAAGGRLANAFGLVDCLGNAAELVSDGSARGGSWADALALARAANRLDLEAGTRHAGVGLRLAYRP